MILFQLLFQTLQDPVDKLAKKKGKNKAKAETEEAKKEETTDDQWASRNIYCYARKPNTYANSENVEYMYGQCSVWTETKNFRKPAVGQPDSSPRHQLRLFS